MSEAKPFASLSSGLLARKGAAKPAMRRPNFNVNPNQSANGQDDLGWNDMGYDVDPDISQEAPTDKAVFNPLANAVEVPKPEVKQQQERIAAQLQAPVEQDVHQVNDAPRAEPVALRPQSYETVDVQKEAQNYEPQQNIPTIEKPFLVQKVAPKKRVSARKAGTAKSKAAFTLRLDPERHLKLRLACAINNISAQKFVTDALDQKLSEMEQIDLLSGQIAQNK